MKMQVAAFIAGLALLAVVIPVQAHHPFSAEYNKDKPVTVTGTVTKVEWTNPHAHIYMSVKDDNGRMNIWAFELAGVKKLHDLGWKKDTLKMGDEITVVGWKANDGSNRGNANTITMGGGTKLEAGSSYFDQNTKTPISNN
jgi:tRNA(Ile2) C34 agmatinyltransferase TiaS